MTSATATADQVSPKPRFTARQWAIGSAVVFVIGLAPATLEISGPFGA